MCIRSPGVVAFACDDSFGADFYFDLATLQLSQASTLPVSFNPNFFAVVVVLSLLAWPSNR